MLTPSFHAQCLLPAWRHSHDSVTNQSHTHGSHFYLHPPLWALLIPVFLHLHLEIPNDLKCHLFQEHYLSLLYQAWSSTTVSSLAKRHHQYAMPQSAIKTKFLSSSSSSFPISTPPKALFLLFLKFIHFCPSPHRPRLASSQILPFLSITTILALIQTAIISHMSFLSNLPASFPASLASLKVILSNLKSNFIFPY